MKNNILIIFAHPKFENSVNNALLVQSIPDVPEITFNDLYERYPDFNIDIDYEKKLLTDNQIVIFHHPFYWYSSPPLLKQWIDLVLEFGWAYGPGGRALEGKMIFNVITTGGPGAAYTREGHNRFTIAELLAPFNQTAVLCRMDYLPPFTMHGTHRLSAEERIFTAGLYRKLLEKLVIGDFEAEEAKQFSCLNDWISNNDNKNYQK